MKFYLHSFLIFVYNTISLNYLLPSMYSSFFFSSRRFWEGKRVKIMEHGAGTSRYFPKGKLRALIFQQKPAIIIPWLLNLAACSHFHFFNYVSPISLKSKSNIGFWHHNISFIGSCGNLNLPFTTWLQETTGTRTH